MQHHVGRQLAIALLVAAFSALVPHSSRSQTPGADVQFRLAQGLEQAGEYEEAAKLYRDLYVREPTNPAYFDALQRVLIHLKRYEDAIGLISDRLVRTPGDVSLRAQLGSVYYRGGMEQRAMEEWNSAIAVSPKNPNVYRIVAAVMVENRLLDRAIAVYRRGRESCGDPLLFSFELSQLLAVSMDYRGSTMEMVRWLAANPGQLSVVQARLSSFTGKPDGRAAAIGSVREVLREREDPRLLELLAWLYLEGKSFEEAYDVTQRLDYITKGQGMIILAFADRAYRERAFSTASRAYREAIGIPLPAAKIPAARYGYALTLKELAASVDTLTQPLGVHPPTDGESSARYRDALIAFRRIIQDYPRTEWSAKSYYQIGTIEFQNFFDLDQALGSFRRVGEEAGGLREIRYDVALKSGQIHVARGDTGHAAEAFRLVAGARDGLPDQTDEAAFRLAELDFFAGRIAEAKARCAGITVNLRADYANDALQLLAFLENNSSASPEALGQFGRAEFLSRQRKNTEAIALLRDLVARFPEGPLVGDALMRIAGLQQEAGLYREAIESYELALVRSRESSIMSDRAQFSIGEIYDFGLRDRTAAITAYEKLLADFPRSVWSSTARKRIRFLRGDAL